MEISRRSKITFYLLEGGKLILDFKLILLILTFIIPYSILGEELANVISGLLVLIYVILAIKEHLEINKKYAVLLIILNAVALLSIAFSPNLMKSLSGYIVFLNGIIFYLAFSASRENKKNNISILVYVLAVLGILYITVQGAIFHTRIYGNIGYANTYALLMLSALYLNELDKTKKFYNPLRVIFMLAIIYTGSRTTLLLMLIYVALKLTEEVKNKSRSFTILLLICTFVIYIIFESCGIGAVLIVIPAAYLFSMLCRQAKRRTMDIITITFVVISILFVFVYKTNTVQRIKNISPVNGSLQERLVSYEDALKYSGKHLLGLGINSFQYHEYENQSAFYDMKYIHNSFIQILYDMGIQGFASFILVMLYGLNLLLKGHYPFKKYIVCLYITIFIHSLLDFDLIYTPIFILPVMLVAYFSNDSNQKITINKLVKAAFISPLVILASYAVLVNSLYSLGRYYIHNNDYYTSRTIYELCSKISYKDSESFYNIAMTYQMEYNDAHSSVALDKSLCNLLQAEKFNKNDPRITWDIAYNYEKHNDTVKCIIYRDKLVKSERFYYKQYQTYYNYLNTLSQNDKSIDYRQKIEDLKDKYNAAVKCLNIKAKYMPNQLPKQFDDMLKLKWEE